MEGDEQMMQHEEEADPRTWNYVRLSAEAHVLLAWKESDPEKSYRSYNSDLGQQTRSAPRQQV